MAIHNNQSRMVVALLAVGSHLCGCAIESHNALSDPESATPDQRVVGTWYSADPAKQQQSTYLHVGLADGIDPIQRDANFESKEVTEKVQQEHPERFKSCMRATRVDFHDGRLFSQSAVFFPTQLGSAWYVSLPYYQQDNRGKIALIYNFWRYNLEGDTLIVWGPGECKTVVIEAIKRGKLRGKVRTGMIVGEYPELTDSTENLRKYLKAEGDAKIAKTQGVKFRRVTP